MPLPERRRPDVTVVVPTRLHLDHAIFILIEQGQSFTVEPSPVQPEVWHVGILNEAVPLIASAFTGGLRDAGTIADYLRNFERHGD